LKTRIFSFNNRGPKLSCLIINCQELKCLKAACLPVRFLAYSENIENTQEQKASENDSNVQEASEQVQQPAEEQSVEKVDDAQEAPKEVSEEAPKETPKEAPVSKAEKVKASEKAVAAESEAPEIIEKVISINRITKVTKGGKKLSFSALVVVGDTRGNVGYSLSKAAEVAIAIRKAMATAKKNMIKIPMRGTTIPHEIIGQCSGSRVLLKPASDGTGVIASGPVRAVCDGAGIHNILTKCHRSNNPINVVKATINGLSRLKTRGGVLNE